MKDVLMGTKPTNPTNQPTAQQNKTDARASNWWYLAGVAGTLGSIIAIIYVLISDSKKKLFSLLYLIGIIGPIIVYAVTKDADPKLANLSLKFFIGNLVGLVIFTIVALSLFLGIFNNTSYGGFNTCIAKAGFLCGDTIYNHTTGTLSITFGQATGQTLLTPKFAFVNQTSNAYVIQHGLSGYPRLISTSNDNLTPGQQITITLPATNPISVGTPLTGYIWIAYTTTAGGPVYYNQVATIVTKAV